MDARTKRPSSTARGAAAFHRRSRAFRASNPFGAGQPIVRCERTYRSTREAPGAPFMVVSVHEGLRAGRLGTRALAAVFARVSLAPVVRAPMDELCAGDRAHLRGGGRGL